MLRDERRHLVEPVERARQAHEHEVRVGHELGREGHRPHRVGEPRARRVLGERALAGHEILVHPDASRPGIGRTERDRAVGVVDDDEPARPDRLDACGRFIEHESVSGIRCFETRPLDVGVTAQRTEIEGHAPRVRMAA